MKRRGLFSILVAVLLVATLVVFLVSFQVRANECALVFTFGRVARSLTEPGLYWKLPYPIQTFQRYDRRIRVSEGKFHEVPTADAKYVVVTMAIGWSIQDPVRFYTAVRTPSQAQDQLQNLIGSYRNEAIGKHPFNHFVSIDPKQLAFESIEAEIQSAAQKTAETDYGVHVDFVRITQLNLSEKTTESVHNRMKAERESIAKDYRSQGTRKADEIRAQANKEKADILSKADRQATETRAQGDTAAAKYYAEFEKNPELAIWLRKLDAFRRIKEGTTFILDTRTPPYDLLRLQPSIPGVESAPEKSAPKPKAEPKPEK